MSATQVDGAGPHIRKVSPSKRVKALHRNAPDMLSLLSLRAFVRGVTKRGSDSPAGANEAALASKWHANKKAVR